MTALHVLPSRVGWPLRQGRYLTARTEEQFNNKQSLSGVIGTGVGSRTRVLWILGLEHTGGTHCRAQ